MTDRRRYSSARTEDSYHYSDDFSDDEPSPVKSAPEKQRTRGRGGRNQSKGRGRGRGGGRNSQARSDTQVDVVTRRMLSANKMKVNELSNQLEDMRKQMKVVTDENKLFKRMQYKQEKALVKFEDRESELPQMIQAHNNEVRALKEQLRRMRDKYDKTDRYLRDAEDELERVNTKVKKYKALADQKDLAERSDLDRRLNKAELSIEEKEVRIKELERHLEILKKNHKHELGIERARYKESQRHVEMLNENNSRLEAVLREKEKLLDASNIYSNRGGGVRVTSYNGTPAESPAPRRQTLNKKKSESMSDIGPRDKARVYEEKRKATEFGKKKEKEKAAPPLSQRSNSQQPTEARQKREDKDREKEDPSASATFLTNGEEEGGPKFNFTSVQRQDSESDFWRRQEEKYKQDTDNRKKQEEERTRRKKEEEEEEAKESARFQQQRDKFQRDLEERERRERERQEADDRERQRQEEEKRKQREKQEREQREREDKDRRERETRERERKEKERLDKDPRMVEERRKKDELLRKLQQLDANRTGSQADPNPDPFAPADSTRRPAGRGDQPPSSSSVFAPSPSKKDKDPFGIGDEVGFSLSPSHKKDYSFTRPVENMHRGKPSRARGEGDDDDIGGYQPSFTSGKAASSSSSSGKKKKAASLFDDDDVLKPSQPKNDPDRKSKLMSDLFGSHLATNSPSTATTNGKKDDSSDPLFTSAKSPPSSSKTGGLGNKRSSGFPWDSTSSTKANGAGHRDSSTLFGGGAALVDDDLKGGRGEGLKSSALLPKRSKQPTTTFPSKPAVGEVDDLDDDLEEVIL